MASTTVSSFNDLMQQFLDDLEIAFPNDSDIKKYQATFGLLRKSNARKPMNEFMASVGPYASQIMEKNEVFFLETETEFMSLLNIKELWAQATVRGWARRGRGMRNDCGVCGGEKGTWACLCPRRQRARAVNHDTHL